MCSRDWWVMQISSNLTCIPLAGMRIEQLPRVCRAQQTEHHIGWPGIPWECSHTRHSELTQLQHARKIGHGVKEQSCQLSQFIESASVRATCPYGDNSRSRTAFLYSLVGLCFYPHRSPYALLQCPIITLEVAPPNAGQSNLVALQCCLWSLDDAVSSASSLPTCCACTAHASKDFATASCCFLTLYCSHSSVIHEQ